jgi:hypothetical protein
MRIYLTNMTESPANSFLPLTKRLQPVVSKCLLGWPDLLQSAIVLAKLLFYSMYFQHKRALLNVQHLPYLEIYGGMSTHCHVYLWLGFLDTEVAKRSPRAQSNEIEMVC